ncbi:hypothetical protein VTN02DRAFT_6556 [Thermoascus thermophilus]
MAQDLNSLLERLRQAEQRAQQAEQQLEPSTLLGLLEGCHELSLAIRVETNPTLTTQGDPTNPVNRRRPKRIIPWEDFPALQEGIWETLYEDPDFCTRRAFASKHQLELIRNDIRPIRSEIQLRDFERDTVDRFVRLILNEVHNNDRLRRSFKLHGDITFEDHNIGDTTSALGNPMEQLQTADSAPWPPSTPDRTQSTRPPTYRRRRNRRADQFCFHVISDEQRVPVYAVEHKAPHKLSLAEILAGLHEMDLENDVINTNGDSFEYYATRLVAAVITQLFSYMVDIGVRYGYICTGEALICLNITEDPSVVQYYLLVPNRDVADDDEHRLHRTAVAQVLAFTLNALQADPPPQSWYDAINQLDTWEVEYLNILQEIPESVRKEPPSSEYKPPPWKPVKRSPYNLRRRCRPSPQLSRRDQGDDDEDDEAGAPPSPSPFSSDSSRGARGGQGRGRGRGRGQGRGSGARGPKGTKSTKKGMQHEYCTMKCLSGLAERGPLDPLCPNVKEHGHLCHRLNAHDLTRLLSDQLSRDRENGFEQLHIVGRTGFLLKATLLSHGYTVILKATSAEQLPSLKQEVSAYHRLRSLQGRQVPVYIGDFAPQVSYWYHGQRMVHMLILSWAGVRAKKVMTQQDEPLFLQQRDEILSRIRACGVTHNDAEWRNILWNRETHGLVVIDFESPPKKPVIRDNRKRSRGQD